MKNIIPLFIFLLTFSLAFSQQKNHFSLSLGPSFPLGQYSNKDIISNSSGIAKTGQYVGLSWSRLLNKKLGFTVLLAGQRNPLDNQSMERQLSVTPIGSGVYFTDDPNRPPPPSYFKTYRNWNVEKHSWRMGLLMVGGYSELPLSPSGKISLIGNMLVGMIYASSPEVNGTSNTDTTTATLTQKSKATTGFSYSASAGLRCQLTNRVFITGSIQYLGTNKLNFESVKSSFTTTSGKPQSMNYQVSYSQTVADGRQIISSLNLLLGIGLSIF